MIPLKMYKDAIMQYYLESTPCTFSKDKWDVKEGTGKSMKHALYVLWYAKMHQSDQAEVMSNSERNQACSLSHNQVKLV